MNIGAGSTGDSPRISVIIPLYNHEKYIGEALRSVLNQTFSDFEVIIINDGSTDGSEAAVKGIRDERIRYFSQENQGAAFTINRGLGLARGEYVSILNSDDVYHPERLAECLAVLDADPELAAVFSNVDVIDGDGKAISRPDSPAYDWEKRDPETSFKNEQSMVLDLLAGNFLLTTSNLFCRKNVFSRIGTFINLRYTHDYEFFLRLCYHEQVRVLQKHLYRYRIHELNTVKTNEAEVSYEVGLVLSHVLLNYDLKRFFPAEGRVFDDMLKFFNSLYACNTEKMILTLLVFGGLHESLKTGFLQVLSEDGDNAFRNACIRRVQQSIDEWNEAQKAFQRLHQEIPQVHRQLHQQIHDMEYALQEQLRQSGEQLRQNQEQLRLNQEQLKQGQEQLRLKDEEVRALLHSRAYRLGRLLTWPLRKMRGSQ